MSSFLAAISAIGAVILTVLYTLRPKKDLQIQHLEDQKKAQESHIDELKAQQETLKDKVTEEQKSVSDDGKVIFWTKYLKDKDDKKDNS